MEVRYQLHTRDTEWDLLDGSATLGSLRQMTEALVTVP